MAMVVGPASLHSPTRASAQASSTTPNEHNASPNGNPQATASADSNGRPAKSGLSASTPSALVPIKPTMKDQGTQTCVFAECTPNQDVSTRPVVVIVGFQDPSTADTRAAMQQAMDVLSQTMNNMQSQLGVDASVVISNSNISTQAQQDASVAMGPMLWPSHGEL